MWTREIKKEKKFAGGGVRLPRRVEMRSKPCLGVDVLVKVMEDGSIELSMNGTAQWKGPGQFHEFCRAMTVYADIALEELTTTPLSDTI